MVDIDKCVGCGTTFIKDDKYKAWNWFTCETCGIDYVKRDGKWEVDE